MSVVVVMGAVVQYGIHVYSCSRVSFIVSKCRIQRLVKGVTFRFRLEITDVGLLQNSVIGGPLVWFWKEKSRCIADDGNAGSKKG